MGKPDEHLLEGGLGDRVVLHEARVLQPPRLTREVVLMRGGLLAHRLHRPQQVRQPGLTPHPVLQVAEVALQEGGPGDGALDVRLHGGKVLGLDVEVEGVALREAVLDVLQRAQHAELPADHDADAVAQRLALLHRVRRQHHAPVGHGGGDDVPHEAARLRVHAGGGLVEQHHGGVPDERNAHAQLALVAAAVAPGLPVGVPRQVHPLQQRRHHLLNVLMGHAADGGVEAEVLARGHVGLDAVELRAVANQPPRLVQLLHDAVHGGAPGGVRPALHGGVAGGGRVLPGEHAEGAGLAGAIDAQQPEALPAAHREGQRLDGGVVVAVGLGQAVHHHHLIRRLARLGEVRHVGALRRHVLVLVSVVRRGHPLREEDLLVQLDEQHQSEKHHPLQEQEDQVVARHLEVEHAAVVEAVCELRELVEQAFFAVVLREVVDATREGIVGDQPEHPLQHPVYILRGFGVELVEHHR
mmetsp:Transcript_8492/g.17583  ORF Transcript_8492/g.17583 Transcript_8492/m.17583 type:complete len:469 (-) Transcript_8492:2286-3692(-)